GRCAALRAAARAPRRGISALGSGRSTPRPARSRRAPSPSASCAVVARSAMETISFARGAPAPDLLPVDELADCAETVLAREGKTILSYGAGAGYAPLRELIGEWFGVHPGRVVITNGGRQGV